MTAGRPSLYSTELINRICTEVASGNNINVLCRECDWMPDEKTVYNWLKDPEKQEFFQKYALAREVRADVRSDKIDEINSQLLSGLIPSDVARVAIDTLFRQAGFEKPKYYGNKTEVAHNGNIDINATLKEVLITISGNTADLPYHDKKLTIEELKKDV